MVFEIEDGSTLEEERKRLKALYTYEVLDTEFEESFDVLTRLASQICEVPICVVSLLDKDRQWFKSRVGIDVSETPRSAAFCQFAIQGTNLLEIRDATKDERVATNPLVTGEPKIRFYAGAPLINPEGFNLGTLCVIDQKPRALTDHQRTALRVLAQQVVTLLELRLQSQQLAVAKQTNRQGDARLLVLESQLARTASELDVIRLAFDENSHVALQLVSQMQAEFIQSGLALETFFASLEHVLNATGSELGFIGEVLEQEGGVCYQELAGVRSHEAGFQRLVGPVASTLLLGRSLRAVLLKRETIHIEEFSEGGNSLLELEAVVLVPIHCGSAMVGVLGLANRPCGFRTTLLDILAPVFSTLGYLIQAFRANRQRELFEAQLAESERHLSLVLEGSRLGTWDWNLVTGVIDSNAQWAGMLGYNPCDIETSPELWEELIHPEDRERVFSELTAHFEGRSQFFEIEHRMRASDGGWRWVLARGEVVERTDTGEALRACGTHLDITERKEFESLLTEQALRMRVLNQIAAQGHRGYEWQVDQILRQVCEVLGMEVGTVSSVEQAFLEVVYAHSPVGGPEPGTRYPLEKTCGALTLEKGGALAIKEMGVSEYRENPCYQESGIESYLGAPLVVNERVFGTVSFTSSLAREEPFSEADEEFIELVSRWVASILEQAEAADALAQLNEELARSNRDLDEFAYIASHDLKAPLRGIEHLANWVLEDSAGKLEGECEENLRLLKSRVLRLQRLLEDLLEYARLGRVEEKVAVIDTRELLRDVIEMMSVENSFRFDLDDSLPELVLPRAPVEKVFRNLIGNAIKHHDRDEGVISIHGGAGEKKGYVKFCVNDDGPGISPQYHEQIFEMFRTLQGRDQVESSGMGLSFVKKVVEGFGGSVHVESKGSRGTTVVFSLPERLER